MRCEETHIGRTRPLGFEPDLPLGSFSLELHDSILKLSNRSFEDCSFLLLKRLEAKEKGRSEAVSSRVREATKTKERRRDSRAGSSSFVPTLRASPVP